MLQKINNWLNRRVLEMESLAAELQMDFYKKDEYGLIQLVKDFQLFEGSTSREIYNIMRLHNIYDGFKMDIFDCLVNNDNEGTYEKQTIFFVQSKKLQLPEFYLRPEHFFDKVAAFLGWDDIDFEKFPRFSDQYHLTGNDESGIRRTMNDDLLHFFSIEKNWRLEGIGYFLIFYKKEQVLTPNQIKDLYQKGLKIHDLLAVE